MRRYAIVGCIALCAACGGDETNSNNANNANNANNTNNTTLNNATNNVADMGDTSDAGMDTSTGDPDMGDDMGMEDPVNEVRSSAADARAQAATGSLADRLDLMLYAARAESALGDDPDAAAEGLMPLAYTWSRVQNELRIESTEKSLRSLRRLKLRNGVTDYDDDISAMERLRERLKDQKALLEMTDTEPTTTQARFPQRVVLTHLGGANESVSTTLSSDVDMLSFRIVCEAQSVPRWNNVLNTFGTVNWSLAVTGLNPGLTVSDATPQRAGGFTPGNKDITTVTLTSGDTAQSAVDCVIDALGTSQKVTTLVTPTAEQEGVLESSSTNFDLLLGDLATKVEKDIEASTAPDEDKEAVVETVVTLVDESTETLAAVYDPIGPIEESRLRETSMRSRLFRRSAQAIIDTLPEDFDGTREALRKLIIATIRMGDVSQNAVDETAGILTVSGNQGSGAGSLQETVTTAKNGATIVIDANVSTIDLSTAGPIKIDRSMTIVGDTGGMPILSGGGQTHLMEVDAPGEIVTLQNVFFTDGAGVDGAGLVVKAGTVILEKCAFTNNDATGDGGAIYVAPGANVIANGPTFYGNSANRGGATAGNVTLTRAWIDTNSAMLGGALLNPHLVQNSVIRVGSATNGGGIAYSDTGNYTLSFNTFDSNSAVTSGGAIMVGPQAQVVMYGNNFDAANSAPLGPAVRQAGTVTGSFNVLVDASGAPALSMGSNIVATMDTIAGANGVKTTLEPAGDALNAASASDCAAFANFEDLNGIVRSTTGPCDAGAYEITACPDGCSGNGVCAETTCSCRPGFAGDNCADRLEGL